MVEAEFCCNVNSIFFDPANITLEQLNLRCEGTMNTALKIVFCEIGEDYLKATMPVFENTIQPLKMLNGGASLAMIETLGSMAANLALDRSKFVALGQSVTCNHLKPVKMGESVTATTKPVHIGRQSQVWKVFIEDERAQTICFGTITMAVVALEKLNNS